MVLDLDSINLNKVNVDFDADMDAGYESEEVQIKTVSQLQGVYSSKGKFNGDELRAERRQKNRVRKQNQYLTQVRLPMPDLND